MAGYAFDFSRSNNALAAERHGRFPASRVAKQLGLPTPFVRECCRFASGREFHHVSKFYNSVKYYDTELIRRWMRGDPEGIDEDEGSFAEVFAAWKARMSAVRTQEYRNVTVKWLEWSGTRSHPTATAETAMGCDVVDEGGKFVKVRLPSGATMRKGKATRGFEVYDSSGNRVVLQKDRSEV